MNKSEFERKRQAIVDEWAAKSTPAQVSAYIDLKVRALAKEKGLGYVDAFAAFSASHRDTLEVWQQTQKHVQHYNAGPWVDAPGVTVGERPTPQQIHEKILAYMKKHKCDYPTGFKAVTEELGLTQVAS